MRDVMRNVIKIDQSKRLFFVSDLHLNHDKEFLWGKRGYQSSSEHIEGLLSRLAEIADDDTVLINLGDSTFRDPKHEMFDRLAALPFHKHYHVWGNHPSGAKQAYQKAVRSLIPNVWSDNVEVYPADFKNVTFVGWQALFSYQRQMIHAQHFPLEIWDEMKNGVWHVCGHSHGSLDKTNGDVVTNGKIMDVGIESALDNFGDSVVSFDQVNQFMAKRPIIKKDHH